MAKKPDEKTKKHRGTPLQVRLTEEEKEIFVHAAERQHLTLSAWLRLAGLQFAREQERAAAS